MSKVVVFIPDDLLNIPFYLDGDVKKYFSVNAKNKGVEIQTMLIELLRKVIYLNRR